MAAGKVALTIAGSDPSGGAGIQADLKTFAALGVYGASVITAVTSQDFNAVYFVKELDAETVKNQLRAVMNGLPVTAVKIGMLYSGAVVETVCEQLSLWKTVPMVLDTVFAATSGVPLLRPAAIEKLIDNLIPMSALITPNIPEAEILSGEKISSEAEQKRVGSLLFEKLNVPVLLKGGHLPDQALDILIDRQGIVEYRSEMIRGINTHGSGCTLASAITAGLALGLPLRSAISKAKNYVNASMRHALRLSEAASVMNHFWQDKT